MDSINHRTQTKKFCGTKNGQITSELLDVFLYGKRKIQEIDLDSAKRQKLGQGKCVKPLKCEYKLFLLLVNIISYALLTEVLHLCLLNKRHS